MPNTVVFLWISGVAALPGSPGVAGPDPVVSASALAELRDFGAARGLSFVAVSSARPRGLPANDAQLVDALEGELEQARTALSALEEASASARLHKVEEQLLAHPHLPQAGFLLAECLSLQAQAARASSPAIAAELEARRFALEGPRAAAFGEPAKAPAPLASITLELRGLAATDELELDGVRQAAGTTHVTLMPGLHQARVWRAGRPIFATFAQVTAEQTALSLAVPARVPCSAEDLESVARAPTDLQGPLPPGIACEHWARVREEGKGVAVSLCQHSQCGAFQHWQHREPVPFAPIAVERARFPAWAGFALAGGAALVASGVVLWQSGAFERGRPNTATWEYTGPNQQGLRF